MDKDPKTLSTETMRALSKIANDDSDEEEMFTRPPSPRPSDERQAVVLHSQVMQEWEDSIRYSTKSGRTDRHIASFRRTGSRGPVPRMLTSLESRDSDSESV